MDERTRRSLVMGAAVVAIAAIAIAVATSGSHDDAEPRSSEPREVEARSSSSSSSSGLGSPAVAAPHAPVLDAGRPDAGTEAIAIVEQAAPTPAAAPPPREPAPPPRELVRFARPMTLEDDLEHASRLYDYIVVRRADLRRRIEERERDGDESGLAAMRRELEGLDAAEGDARARVDRIAAQLREARGSEGEGEQAP
ncbi:hypothetical protein [Sandaracinus amylolyticus]|uniref:hypothetical protein n=1 Tax=Sandaracinus amylolyticus TaxID=927083 RepID=UPI001F3ED34D|nr:hypothetical protein [Sandaracinus amylolyticus]UJR83756.1 Hypothetical protein I5071_58270 [Sandaracinus amylolyticus]